MTLLTTPKECDIYRKYILFLNTNNNVTHKHSYTLIK